MLEEKHLTFCISQEVLGCAAIIKVSPKYQPPNHKNLFLFTLYVLHESLEASALHSPSGTHIDRHVHVTASQVKHMTSKVPQRG